MDSLDAVSPIDGRYRSKTGELSEYFSERALIGYRMEVEVRYLIALSEHPETDLREFSHLEKLELERLAEHGDADFVKAIEAKTNHDVKAVEYYIRDKLKGTSLEDSVEWIHFGLTSEDTNNLAYGLIIVNALEDVLQPSLRSVYQELEKLSKEYADLPMLARTHGQPASPTTVGKEFKVFASRLRRQIEKLEDFKLLVKLNGATGNYNAHHAAYPSIDWLKFSQQFINDLTDANGITRAAIEPNPITTQIEPHDTYAELFDLMSRINTILIDFNQDMWRYVSDDWIKQKPKEGEVGSSTMPHKVNPIDFENSEGNLGIANALFAYFSRKSPISRLQRDLSDSTVERNFGVAFAHSLIGYKSTLRGLGKIEINKEKVTEVLENHPEVISEAFQTILRRENIADPYELLKGMTRGKKATLNELREFIDGLNIPDRVRRELKEITPQNYIGIAEILGSGTGY